MGTVATIQRNVRPPAPEVDATPVTFEVLGADESRQLVSEWDACASLAAGNPFPQTPWFASAVWLQAAASGEMCLATGRDASGTLQVVAPFVLARPRVPYFGLRTLRPLALHCQEISGFVVGNADRARATRWMVEQVLSGQPTWDVLHFDAIDPASSLFASLIDVAANTGMQVLCSAPLPTPVLTPVRRGRIDLPGPSSRFRRNIRRAWRLARESGHEVTCREMSWEWWEHAPAIAEIYRERWGEGEGPGSGYALHDPVAQEVLDLLFSRLDRYFRAHLFGAFVEGQLAAYVICFRSGREVTLWSACMAERFRELSVGMLLWDHCLHEIAAWPDVDRINFGKGGDRYKLDWSDSTYSVCEVAVVRARGWRRRRALRLFGQLGPLPSSR
ncbi:MAG: GNAT family N-acetyltransferase [Planctomycetota bacterium]